MPPGQVFRLSTFMIVCSLFLTNSSNAKPTGPKDTEADLEALRTRLDETRQSNGLKLSGNRDAVSPLGSSQKDKKPLKRGLNGNKARSSTNLAARGLSTMITDAKNSVVNTLSSVVSPIDEGARKAVNGVGLVTGIFSGLATGIGTQAFNSLVRVHNAGLDNLTKLKDLTRKAGRSVVDFGSTVVSETADVLDAVREENTKLLRKVTENIPIVRHLVPLNSVAELATTCGLKSCANGVKNLGNLAVDALTFTKGEETEGSKGGVGGIMDKVEGLSGAELFSAGVAFSTSADNMDFLKKVVETGGAESAFRIGKAIGRHKSAGGK